MGGPYVYCPGSLWYRSEAVVDPNLKRFISPFLGKVEKYNWAGMRDVADGFIRVEGEFLGGSLVETSKAAQAIESRYPLLGWLNELWAMNDVNHQSSLHEWIRFEESMEAFNSLAEQRRNAILSGVERLFDAERHSTQRAKYMELKFVPLPLKDEDAVFLTIQSSAHIAVVTHRQYEEEARKQAIQIFEKVAEVVQETEEAGEASGRVVLPDIGGTIDPLMLGALMGLAKEAVLVQDAEQASEDYLMSKYGISGC